MPVHLEVVASYPEKSCSHCLYGQLLRMAMVLRAAKDALTVSVSNKESEVVIFVNTLGEAIKLLEPVSKQKRQLYQS